MSLRKQTVPDWQAIIVNDSGRKLQADGYTMLNTGGRKGSGYARNMGLAAAQSPWVTFLDADDIMMPNALEAMVRCAAAYSCGGYVFGDAWTVAGDGSIDYFAARNFDRERLSRFNLHTVTALVPTQRARSVGFPEGVLWEDWMFYIALSRAGCCGVRIPYPLIAYRLDTGTNRAEAYTQQEALLKLVREQKKEGTEMGCGCGQTPEQTAAQVAAAQWPSAQSGQVRMEFTGIERGTLSFFVNGRIYQGANNDVDRFAVVQAADVHRMIETQKWRVVPTVDQSFDPAEVIKSYEV